MTPGVTDIGWVLRLPQQTPMSLNHRTHWHVKSVLTKGFRDAAHTLCRNERVPRLERLTFQLAYQPGTNRRRDVDSLVPTSKACLDGIRDAGVVPDDTPEYVDHLMPRLLPVVKHEPALWMVLSRAAT